MKEKNYCIDNSQLRKAKIRLTIDYYAVVLITVGLIAMCLFFLFTGHNTKEQISWVVIPILCLLVPYALVVLYKVATNWHRFLLICKAKKKVEAFKKNLSYIVRSEYGIVTEDNVNEVRKLACTLYSTSTGDTRMNKMYYAEPEFFNRMILKDVEYMAIYGRTTGLLDRIDLV